MKTKKDFERNNKDKVTRDQREDKNTQGKKPFDKKTYRLKKYSNKYKVDQWEDRRKKAVLRRYYKDVEKDKRDIARKAENVKRDSKDDNEEESSSSSNSKGNAFHAAKKEYIKKKEEKKRRKEELERKKTEKIEALKKYREEKALKYKKLSKKTKKGQPVMKDRLEMLLEKIQQTTENND